MAAAAEVPDIRVDYAQAYRSQISFVGMALAGLALAAQLVAGLFGGILYGRRSPSTWSPSPRC